MSEAPYPEYEGLLVLAAESLRRDGSFIDPVKWRMMQAVPRNTDWALSVLRTYRRGDPLALHMLLLAHGQDIDPPLPDWLAEVREKQAAARRREEEAAAARARALDEAWASIWKALPQQVGVAYNYSGPGHYETYSSGADHIILSEDLVFGRMKRVKGWAMCTTPSSARHQSFDLKPDHPTKRRATCKACLRAAAKVAGVELPEILLRNGHR